jgi:hypothetical protein
VIETLLEPVESDKDDTCVDEDWVSNTCDKIKHDLLISM